MWHWDKWLNSPTNTSHICKPWPKFAAGENKHHDRIEFQVDQFILFTNALFAIAVTLLAVEIKVPPLHHIIDHNALQGMLWLIPKFGSFLIGFFVIALLLRPTWKSLLAFVALLFFMGEAHELMHTGLGQLL